MKLIAVLLAAGESVVHWQRAKDYLSDLRDGRLVERVRCLNKALESDHVRFTHWS
jgi:hypothetical protein